MKMHKTLVLISIANLVICFLAFSLLNYFQRDDPNAVGINSALGWIFWLGIFSIIAPLFISDAVRDKLLEREYVGGTLLFGLINVVIPIFCASVAS